jgi:RND family efflux transporter MFP subunit
MGYAVPSVTVRVSTALGLLLLGVSLGCSRSQAEAPKSAAPAEARAIQVTTARAEARALQRRVETSGSLLAWDEVIAKGELAGTIARLRVDLGDRVQAGAVLAEYDRRELQIAVDQANADLLSAREALARGRASVVGAEAQLRRARDNAPSLEADVARARSQFEWAQSELERAQRLFERDLIAARDVDSARNGYNVAAAQLRAAETAAAQHPDQVRVADAQRDSDIAALRGAEAQVKQREAMLALTEKRLGDTTVRAPISGFIAKRHLAAGEYIKDNTPLFTIVAANPLKYVGTVPERNAPDLRAGQSVQLGVEAYPARTFTGSVTRLAPSVEVQTRTLTLEARVPNADGTLRPGFFAKGAVLTREDRSVVFVPADALMVVAGLQKVFVVAEGKARERLVRSGARQGSLVEIVDGVKAGEVVATSNLPSLYEGAAVTGARN